MYRSLHPAEWVELSADVLAAGGPSEMRKTVSDITAEFDGIGGLGGPWGGGGLYFCALACEHWCRLTAHTSGVATLWPHSSTGRPSLWTAVLFRSFQILKFLSSPPPPPTLGRGL